MLLWTPKVKKKTRPDHSICRKTSSNFPVNLVLNREKPASKTAQGHAVQPMPPIFRLDILEYTILHSVKPQSDLWHMTPEISGLAGHQNLPNSGGRYLVAHHRISNSLLRHNLLSRNPHSESGLPSPKRSTLKIFAVISNLRPHFVRSTHQIWPKVVHNCETVVRRAKAFDLQWV